MADGSGISAEIVERALRWALVELGTAGLSDEMGSQVVVAAPPEHQIPVDVAVAGPVVILRRSPEDADRQGRSSFDVLRAKVQPGSVVLVQCPTTVGAAFGSNLALLAAGLRAQAMVTDGLMRDVTRLAQTGITVAGNGTTPRRPTGVPVVETPTASMFGADWATGDWYLRDRDGVIRLSASEAHALGSHLSEAPAAELAALLATG